MTRLGRKQAKLKEKLKRLGIEYDFKGYVEVAKEDGIVVSSTSTKKKKKKKRKEPETNTTNTKSAKKKKKKTKKRRVSAA